MALSRDLAFGGEVLDRGNASFDAFHVKQMATQRAVTAEFNKLPPKDQDAFDVAMKIAMRDLPTPLVSVMRDVWLSARAFYGRSQAPE
jgi:hypothetical protein